MRQLEEVCPQRKYLELVQQRVPCMEALRLKTCLHVEMAAKRAKPDLAHLDARSHKQAMLSAANASWQSY